MAEPHLREQDVKLVEELEVMRTDEGSYLNRGAQWVASIHGRLYKNDMELDSRGGAIVEMSRTGTTAQQAMMSLRKAAEDQGWELR